MDFSTISINSNPPDAPADNCLSCGIFICKSNVFFILLAWTLCGFYAISNVEHLSPASPILKIGVMIFPTATGIIGLAIFSKHCFSGCQKRLNMFDVEDELQDFISVHQSHQIFFDNVYTVRKRSLPPAYEEPPSYEDATKSMKMKSPRNSIEYV